MHHFPDVPLVFWENGLSVQTGTLTRAIIKIAIFTSLLVSAFRDFGGPRQEFFAGPQNTTRATIVFNARMLIDAIVKYCNCKAQLFFKINKLNTRKLLHKTAATCKASVNIEVITSPPSTKSSYIISAYCAYCCIFTSCLYIQTVAGIEYAFPQ